MTRTRPKAFQEPIKSITAVSTSCVTFRIPKDVTLLSEEESKASKYEAPFSWYVRYDTLYYIDANGNEQEINSDDVYHDNKCPKSYDINVDDEDDESNA